jgi:Ca2+/Na+ antiporter
MVNAEVVVYNTAVFIATLPLLEIGADKLVDHSAIVARRFRIPDTLIGLITAGGEWEEVSPQAFTAACMLIILRFQLAVVVASLAHNRASLAIGNIIGSAIANILGAFSLGLLFYDKNKSIQFDRSSRIYSLVLLVLTTFVIPITYFSQKTTWLVCGSILIAFFAIYVGSIGWQISKGNMTAPEDTDDDSSDEESSHEEVDGESSDDESAPIATSEQTNQGLPSKLSRKKAHTVRYHLFYLSFGALAICLAGYVLSHAATIITDELGLSDVLFGVAILALATTLPEKLVAATSGHRGHAGILVANTTGSNIFLLSLCSGIVMLDTSGTFQQGSVKIAELGVLWGSTLAFTATIWFGGRFCRGIGLGMLIAYIVFIILEFTVIHDV